MKDPEAIEKKIENFLTELSKDYELCRYLCNDSVNKEEIKNVYYSGPYWDYDEVVMAIKALLIGKWLSAGEYVHQFESMFSRKFNQKHSTMLNSGSSANLVMLAAVKKVLQWQNLDEVIVSVVGFPTTVAPIVQNNLKPVFVDIELNSLNFDLSRLERQITPKTRAIFVSPVLGNPPDFDRLQEFTAKHNIELLLDNCDSLGSRWRGKFLNEYALASSTSFYPSHHITTMEGGMISSDRKDIIEIARSIACWGRDCNCIGASNLLSSGSCGKRFGAWLEDFDGIVDHRYLFSNLGYNLKPIDLQGAVGIAQLSKFDEIDRKRKEHKRRMQALLERYLQTDIRIPSEINEHAETCWFGTPVICVGDSVREAQEKKEELVTYLEKNGIQTRNYFAGNILLHPGYRTLGDWKDYPRANQVLSDVFFLGCSPQYTDRIFAYVENKLRAWASRNST
jgi:CDP-4-dehydro-6-deoxyglucose reductase, E1